MRQVNFYSISTLDRVRRDWGGGKEPIQINKSVHLRVLHILSDLRAHDIDLLLRVAQRAREERVGVGFEALHGLEVVPRADFFLCGAMANGGPEVS